MIVCVKGGRCLCTCGTMCPLGRMGMAIRCTKEELEKAGVLVVDLDSKNEDHSLAHVPGKTGCVP